MSKESKSKSSTVELVQLSYQPNKPQPKKEFALDVPSKAIEARMAAVGRAITETVGVSWINKPQDRRL